jgi:hypothetical protein
MVVTRDFDHTHEQTLRLDSAERVSGLARHPYTTKPDAFVPLVQGVARCEVEKMPQEGVCEPRTSRGTTVVPQTQSKQGRTQPQAAAPQVTGSSRLSAISASFSRFFLRDVSSIPRLPVGNTHTQESELYPINEGTHPQQNNAWFWQ